VTSRLYRDEAIILRTYKLGEADRIIVMLTRHHGQVRAVAKGVRRTTSRFGARLVILAASTREGEEALVLESWQRVVQHRDPRLGGIGDSLPPMLIIVPRHPRR